MATGILALQGAFAEHAAMLDRLGEPHFEIRQARDLEKPLDRLIIPGGESTVMRRLLHDLDLFDALRARITEGMPVFGTCAGLILLAKQLAPYETVRIGQPLPRFKALTLSGRTFTQQDFRSGEGVVIVWASWSYRSLGCLRAVQEAKRQHPDLQVLTICLDATRKDCEKLLRQFDVTLPTVCDGRMLDSPLLANLSLHDLPDNILVENGRVKQRSLSDEELRKRFLETNHSY